MRGNTRNSAERRELTQEKEVNMKDTRESGKQKTCDNEQRDKEIRRGEREDQVTKNIVESQTPVNSQRGIKRERLGTRPKFSQNLRV